MCQPTGPIQMTQDRISTQISEICSQQFQYVPVMRKAPSTENTQSQTQRSCPGKYTKINNITCDEEFERSCQETGKDK